jgi:hypothetical protein
VSAQHTQGTWGAIHWACHAATTIVVPDLTHFSGKKVVAECESEEDARRIVSCVNALADLPQEALDGGWTRAGLEAYGNRMKAERGELLGELQHMVRFHDQLNQRDIERAKALIAKVMGGAA